MLKWLIRRQLRAFEKAYDYDTSCAREILEIDPKAMTQFGKVVGMARYHKGVSAAPLYASKIAVGLAADCGPCTQLVVTMAEREGVEPGVLRAILGGDERAMPDDVALAYRFTRAVLARDPEADALREQVLGRWGPKGLVSLAFAIAAGGVFPNVKYAMGHGRTCSRVKVGGEFAQVHLPQVV
jgi:hypothetical protein